MAVFQDEIADAETIVDPPQGITTVTGDFASFNSDPDPLPTYTAPTYIGVSTGSVSGSGTSVSAAMPSGGDVPEGGLENIYAIIAYDANVIGDVTPDQTGLEPSRTWSRLTSAYAAGGDIGITVYYKRASPPSHIADYPAEAGPFTFTPAGTGEMSMTLVRVHFTSTVWNYELNNTADLGTHTSFDSYGDPGGLGGGVVSHPVLRLTGFAGSLANTWSASGTTEIADVHSGSWTSLGVYLETMASGASYVNRTATASTSVRAVLVDLALYSSTSTAAAYSGWVKLGLSNPGEFRMNTFGSSMIDTKMAIFDHEPAGIDSRGSGALYYNDDVDFSPWWDTEDDWYHSYIPQDTEGGTFVLPAGTYWIAVWPYEATDWDTSEGDATLTIERIDVPLPPFDTIAEIVYDGTEITRYVDLAKSTFEMSAGPQPARSSIRILDRGHTMSFDTGKEVTLDIDGLRVWGGFVMSVRHGYAFPVDDTSEPELTPRYYILECSDYNILFSKRAIRNKAEPADPMPYFDPGVHDDVIIGQLLEDYSDLGSEGFTTDRVDHVGTPAEDMKTDIAEPPDMFGDAMKRVAQMPGAIFYFDADKYLVYADVDREDAPFKLSDDPNQSDSFGYRAIGLSKDATSLANDAMVWGAALGVSRFTFERYQDDDSIADHGLWQWADYRQDLYRPESVLKRATSYVDGSTQNNRGHKDDAIDIRCTVRKPGLRAGMKVDFESVVYGYHDVIPIRSMRIRFVNPNEALYDLRLAHYIDEAWNTAEFRNLPPDDVRACRHVAIDCTDTIRPDTFDTFDRFTGTHTGERVYDWSPNPMSATRSHFMVSIDRGDDYVMDADLGVTIFPWQSSWQTNGSGSVPYRLPGGDPFATFGVSWANDPSPTFGQVPDPFNGGDGWHFDFELRTLTALDHKGTQYPANLFEVGFFSENNPGGAANVLSRDAGGVGLKSSTVVIRSGTADETADWNWGEDATTYTIDIADASAEVDLSWTPVDGSPDFMWIVGGDQDTGYGEKWIPSQDYTGIGETSPPVELLDRYPDEIYSEDLHWFDILGGEHFGWGANEAKDGNQYNDIPNYTLRYEEADGWGVNSTEGVNWDFVDYEGDDWSDGAMVSGGYGILRVHPSPISGVPGFAEVSPSEPSFGNRDHTFTVRFANVMAAPSEPGGGLYAGLFFDVAGLFVDPGSSMVNFGGDFSTWEVADVDWYSEVMIRIKTTSSGSMMKIWQLGSPEPTAWGYTSDVSTEDDDEFGWFADASLWAGEDGAAIEQTLYIGPGRTGTCNGTIDGSYLLGSVTASDINGNLLTVVEIDGGTGEFAVYGSDPAHELDYADPGTVKYLAYWGPNTLGYNPPTGGYAPPDDFLDFLSAGKAHEVSTGDYHEDRMIATWVMPDDTTYARVKGNIYGDTGHYAVITGGTDEITVGWRLSFTHWDDEGGATGDAGGWDSNGSTISEGTAVIPISGTVDEGTLIEEVNALIVATPGSKVQLHLELTSDEGAYLTPNIVTGYDGNVITFVEDGSGHESTQAFVRFCNPGQEMDVVQAITGGLIEDDDDGVIVCYNDHDSGSPVDIGDAVGGPAGPVYRPQHVRQLGWGSKYDGLNCTMASACIALDRHTEGAKTSNPPLMRSYQSDMVGGTDLHDADDAWHAGYSEDLDVQTDSWATFVSEINSGRGGIVQGDYGQVPNAYSSQLSFNGPHAMYINEFNESGNVLVYDPLATGPRWWPASIIQDYAEAYGGGSVQVGYTQVTG